LAYTFQCAIGRQKPTVFFKKKGAGAVLREFHELTRMEKGWKLFLIQWCRNFKILDFFIEFGHNGRRLVVIS